MRSKALGIFLILVVVIAVGASVNTGNAEQNSTTTTKSGLQTIQIRQVPVNIVSSELSLIFANAIKLGTIQIYPDTIHNQLIVVGSTDDINQIRAAIKQIGLDKQGPFDSTIKISNVPAKLVADAIAQKYFDQIASMQVAVSVDAKRNAVLITAAPSVQVLIRQTVSALDRRNEFVTSIAVGGPSPDLLADTIGFTLRSNRIPQSHFEIYVDRATNRLIIWERGEDRVKIDGLLTGLGVLSHFANRETVIMPNVIPFASPLNDGSMSNASQVATAIATALSTTAPDLRITNVPGTTNLVMTGSVQSLQSAKNLLADIDGPLDQVSLDVIVYEIDDNAAHDYGLQIPSNFVGATVGENPNPTATLSPPPLFGLGVIGRTPTNIQAQFNVLEQSGVAHVIAHPRVITISGRSAMISATVAIPFVVQTANNGFLTSTVTTTTAGVKLQMTPIVNSPSSGCRRVCSKLITIFLDPDVKTIAGVTTNSGIPAIAEQESTTTVEVQDGATVVIGGLLEHEDTSSDTRNPLPILKDMWPFRELFHSKASRSSDTDLYVLVTPRVLPTALPAPDSIGTWEPVPPIPTVVPLISPRPAQRATP